MSDTPLRNGTQTGAKMPDYPKSREMAAYDRLPTEVRHVLQTAPFNVSAADMVMNQAVQDRLAKLGADAPAWLSEQLLLTYRNKILASS